MILVTVHWYPANCNLRNPHLKFCFAKGGLLTPESLSYAAKQQVFHCWVNINWFYPCHALPFPAFYGHAFWRRILWCFLLRKKNASTAPCRFPTVIMTAGCPTIFPAYRCTGTGRWSWIISNAERGIFSIRTVCLRRMPVIFFWFSRTSYMPFCPPSRSRCFMIRLFSTRICWSAGKIGRASCRERV